MLFAVSSKESFEANDYLTSFYKHSSKHPHGWGIAYLRQKNTVVKKESKQAEKSEYLAEILKKPIRSKITLAHIRYATIGNIDISNTHPFTGFDKRANRWTLTHNGTIFEYDPLYSYMRRQNGETDSERIFLYLLDEINKLGSADFEERFALLDRIISDMAKGNKLNLIFTDGEYLYVHTNCRDTLYYLEKDNTVIFATAPLTGERWKKVEFCTLCAYKDGALAQMGTAHKNEYIENTENVKMLYRIFSNL